MIVRRHEDVTDKSGYFLAILAIYNSFYIMLKYAPYFGRFQVTLFSDAPTKLSVVLEDYFDASFLVIQRSKQFKFHLYKNGMHFN